MKTKIFTIAALAATALLASCVKEVPHGVKEGDATYMAISFSVPSGAKTRATTDNNATEAEAALKWVDVFIYNPSTGNQVTHKRLPFSDFSAQPTQGTNSDDYEYTAQTKIATTTGARRIIVGVNLSSTLSAQLSGAMMADFLTVAQTTAIADVTDVDGSKDGFAMFSTKPEDVTLIRDPNFANQENYASIQVERLVAKVAVQKDEEIKVVADGKVDNIKFVLNNTNKATFYVQPADKKDHNWATTNPGDLADGNLSYQIVDEFNTTVKNLHPLYCLENTTKEYRMGQITRVTVRATFVPNTVKVFADGLSNADGYSDQPVNTVATTPADFYSVIYNGGANRAYFFDAAVATAFAADNGSISVKYTDGFCYWDLFVNPKALAPYDVLRNNFYLCNITKIVGPGRATHEVTDPDLPPTASTDLVVDIQILYWNVVTDNFELQN